MDLQIEERAPHVLKAYCFTVVVSLVYLRNFRNFEVFKPGIVYRICEISDGDGK